jgi:hypothetical protein
VSLRVRHAPDSKGDLQETTLSMIGHVGPDPEARLLFVNLLCDEWDLERTKPKQLKTEHEKFRALVKSLRRCGDLGEAAIQKAARELGIDPSEFET